MKKITAVVFDMDGVLFDTERMFLDAWRIIGGREGIDGIEETAVKCIGLSVTDTEAMLRKTYGEDFPIAEYHREIGEIVSRRINEKGMPVKKGAYEILDMLKELRCRVGLASSTAYEKVCAHLDRADMRKYFSVVIGGDMIAHSKPDPEIYLTACRELGCPPQETAAVEDSRNGIISAYRAGLAPILVPDLVVPDGEMLSMAVRRFDDLTQTAEFFRGML